MVGFSGSDAARGGGDGHEHGNGRGHGISFAAAFIVRGG